MGRERKKEIERHVTEGELDETLSSADDADLVRRLSFLKNLYMGDTVGEAAERVGRSESTGDRWADRWNEGGIERLAPSYGGGRPPKLDQEQREELVEFLREGQPWRRHEIQDLIREEFGVDYHPAYLGDFLRSLDLNYSTRTEQPTESDDGETVRESLEAALDQRGDTGGSKVDHQE
jgi:transposase